MLVIPKTIADNAGHDVQESLISVQDEQEKGTNAGFDALSGQAVDPMLHGIYDNTIVKRQILHSAPVIAS